jgi:hypothetical protein
MKTKIILLPILKFNLLGSFIANVKAKLPRKNTEGFIKPPTRDCRAFHDAVLAVLKNDLNAAQAIAASVNYCLSQLIDANVNRAYAVLVENANGFRALGTYVFDLDFSRNLVTVIPARKKLPFFRR